MNLIIREKDGCYSFSRLQVSLMLAAAALMQACTSINTTPTSDSSKTLAQAELVAKSLPFITQNNLRFKDLNKERITMIWIMPID